MYYEGDVMDTKARDTGIAIGLAMLIPALLIRPLFWAIPVKKFTPRADDRERVPSKYDG